MTIRRNLATAAMLATIAAAIEVRAGADKTVNTTADLKAASDATSPQDKQDFVFTYDRLKTTAK